MSATSTWHPSLGTAPSPLQTGLHARRSAVRRWSPSIAGLVVVVALTWWVTNSRLFDVQQLDIRGTERLARADVAAIVGVDPSTNVLWASMEELRRRLEASPWIAEASVSRTLPGTLRIMIEERIPAAVVKGTKMVVASDGVILGERPSGGLPMVAAGRSELRPGNRLAVSLAELAVAASMPGALRGHVVEVFGTANGEVAVRLADATRVVFGDRDRLERKWRALQAVLRWARRSGVSAAWIDVREPSAPALRPERARAGQG